MNGTFQWRTASADHTHLPPEWLTPPCGDTYTFTVVAFYGSYPAGTYSNPSNAVEISGGEPGDPECTRTVVVTFVRVTTGNLGSDGRYDPGDMGAMYGSFFANDSRISLTAAMMIWGSIIIRIITSPI